jgi:DNA gyrase subunit B
MSNDNHTALDAERTTPEKVWAEGNADYSAKDIQVLRDRDHIRQNPGMYIGDTGKNGLHHLVYELVHNCVDEALAGYCRNIVIKLDVDGSCSVADDGRGIPVEMNPDAGVSTLEAVMTIVGAGAKFEKGAYKVSAGLHGMGAKAVTALSEWTEAQVQRDGRTYKQEYERGKATTEVKDIGASKRNGTTVMFKPDPTIFHEVDFDADTLVSRFRELAFLNKGLSIKLEDGRPGGEKVEFKYAGGIAEFVAEKTKDETRLHEPPISIDRTVALESPLEGEVRIEVAMQYTNADSERYFCYTNNTHNPMGGTHLS